jgi:superfamily II DNA or RNA helicase
MYQRLNLLRRYPTLRCTIRRFATHFPFTDEQLEVIKWSRTHNLIVSARPGTGKTTAAEGIMAACPDEPTLYVTFSRALRDKADERIKETTGPMSPHSVYTLHQ